ncbi:MAG: nicotinate-nucleotide adenylyltransferase [Anaerolineae bacterium]
MLRIGIMGGTFDPIHIGHLVIAEEARCRLHLDRVFFVPARISPLKQDDGTLYDDEQRYAMVLAAICSNPAFIASRVDLDRQPPSYTIDTVRLLRSEFGEQHQYHFVLGADSLTTLAKWRHPERILQLARLVVVSRPGYRPDVETLEEAIPGITSATDIFDGLMLDISSTEIRRRIAAGLSVRYLVPDGVLALIDSSPCGSLAR